VHVVATEAAAGCGRKEENFFMRNFYSFYLVFVPTTKKGKIPFMRKVIKKPFCLAPTLLFVLPLDAHVIYLISELTFYFYDAAKRYLIFDSHIIRIELKYLSKIITMMIQTHPACKH
jgi:hypothetical protein